MYQELRGYKTLFAILTTTDSIREASDAFMTQYERPADQSEKAKRRRASYGEEICAMLTGVENPDSMVQITEAEARQRVISIAVSWYGKKRQTVPTGRSLTFTMATPRLPGDTRSGIRMPGVLPMVRRWR